GIFYYFVQGAGGAELVIGDANDQFAALEPGAEVEYASRAGDSPAGEVVHALSRRRRVLPARLALREYNWRTPAVALRGEAAVAAASELGLQSYYGEHFKTPDEGRRLARLRAEEILVARDVCQGECTVLGLAPGRRFTLAGHPVEELDREYVCTEIRCWA